MFVLIIIFAMIGCGLFKDAAPEYFSTPLDAIYATFRIFTGEGWNEIPDTVALNMSNAWAHVIRLYFCIILMLGCIVGMSLLNSVFVDAMVSNGDTSIDDRLDSIEAKLEEIQQKLK
jgi:voltage-gated sodium channel